MPRARIAGEPSTPLTLRLPRCDRRRLAAAAKQCAREVHARGGPLSMSDSLRSVRLRDVQMRGLDTPVASVDATYILRARSPAKASGMQCRAPIRAALEEAIARAVPVSDFTELAAIHRGTLSQFQRTGIADDRLESLLHIGNDR